MPLHNSLSTIAGVHIPFCIVLVVFSVVAPLIGHINLGMVSVELVAIHIVGIDIEQP